MDNRLKVWREAWADMETQGNAGTNVDVKPHSLAGLLWIWSRILVLYKVGKLHLTRSMQLSALSFVEVTLDFMQKGMSKWIVNMQEPSAAVMLSLQKVGRRTHPGIICRLMGERNKRKTAALWHGLGMPVQMNTKVVEDRIASQYLWSWRRLVMGPVKQYWQPKRRISQKSSLLVSEVKRKQCSSVAIRAKRRQCYQEDAIAQGSLVSGASAGPPLIAEIIWDSTNFACKDIQVNIVYSPIHNVSAYLPPMTLRHIKWRSAEAGENLTEQDREQFEKTGFRVRARMESCDVIKYLNHVVEVGFGRSLLTFQCPAHLERMKRAGVRIYHRGTGRWYRVDEEDRCKVSSASASGIEEPLGQPELPDALMDPSVVNVLGATLDQKQSQWTAMHCCASPTGLNLLLYFRSDLFHRSWRDFQGCTKHAVGGFQHSAVQLNFALNVNYQGYFLAKRKEVKSEWQVLFPDPSAEFEAMYQNIALDGRTIPSTSGELIRAQYERLVLDNESYDKKGEFMKQSAWYSIIKLLDHNDPVWHARFYMAEKVAEMLTRTHGKKTKQRVAEVAASVLEFMKNPSNSGGSTDNGKEAYLAEMRALRKKAGNALLLAPRLMHAINLVNGRIMLLVAKVAWTEQSMWSQLKTTPEQDRDMTVRYATGMGETVLKRMWRQALFDSRELHRLGWQIVEGMPVLNLASASGEVLTLNPTIPERLMSFLLHFAEARWWSYAWMCFALPEGFAAVLAEGVQAVEHLQFWRTLWEAATFAESVHGAGHPSAAGVAELREAIYWLDWPLVQWLLRLMAHYLWVPHAVIVQFLLKLFLRLGDTLCVEESHRIGRSMEQRDQQADVLNLLSFFSRLMGENTPLSRRGVPHICPSASGAYRQETDAKPPVPWARACCTEASIPLPPALNVEEKMAKGMFESRTPASGRPSICAAQALVHLFRHGRLSLAGNMWHSLALLPHTLVRARHDVFLVMAQGKYAARAWRASPLAPVEEAACNPSVKGVEAGIKRRWGFNVWVEWVWLFTEDIYEWHYIDVKWVANLEKPEQYGFVAAEEIHADEPHVPAVIEAMVRRGSRKIRKEDRKKSSRV